MDSNKYKIIAGAVLVVTLILIVIFHFTGSDKDQNENGENDFVARGLSGEPTDLVLDFYSGWIDRKKVETVDEKTPNPTNSPLLSYQVYEEVKDFDFSADNTEVDPVLCRADLPNGLRSRVVFSTDNKEQILILSADKQTPQQSIITLEKNNDLWEITDIKCGSGEEGGPMGEFSFENEGSLLKDSLPEGFNTDYWHLVFEQDDMQGHTAALLIDEGSVCVDKEGNESTCDPETFFQTMRVRVQGNISEAGVEVKRIEMI